MALNARLDELTLLHKDAAELCGFLDDRSASLRGIRFLFSLSHTIHCISAWRAFLGVCHRAPPLSFRFKVLGF
jgi:hypothetical protein